ncbi:MAG: tail fiber protein [Chloroflexi bacterium]|nr:tail fiber protein [Chloroflexota bacterium]
MVFNKVKAIAQVIGFVTIGLLAVYGALGVFNGGYPVQASEASAPIKAPRQAPQSAPMLASSSWGSATVPLVMNYQGNLKDTEGNPLSGYYTMTFRIYDDVIAPLTDTLWSETHVSVTVRGGHFSVLLGNNESISETLFNDPDRFVGVQVSGYDEMVPRQRFASVPYGMHANHATTATIAIDAIDAANAVNADTLDGYHATVFPPIGSIIAWHKSFTNTPSLPAGWVECDGTVLNDPDSLYNGQMIPDLNSDVGGVGDGGRFLRGNANSGIFQIDELKSHDHFMGTSAGTDPGPSSTVRMYYVPPPSALKTSLTGGTESRPINMSVVWIMRVK